MKFIIKRSNIKNYIFKLLINSLIFMIFFINRSNYQVKKIDEKFVFIKGISRKDKYGIELNTYIINGIYCIGFNGKSSNTIESSNIYYPPCPFLRPVHFPDSIINPVCEKSSLQIVNFKNNSRNNLPYSIKLDSISNLIKKWNEWRNFTIPNINYYKDKTLEELVKNEYHPFDYGDNIKFENIYNNQKFYKKVVSSRMDEIPDPRRRRLFSFILFNGEFDLLDIYLAEYYEIVDYFVIYESNRTFTGKEKPLYFTRTLFETNRYEKFQDKLIPFPCEIIINEDNGIGYAFPREHVARRTLIEKGLRVVHARHGDLFMHNDLDELPKPHILSRLKKCGGWEYLQAGIGGGPLSFKEDDQNKNSKFAESYFINGDKIKTNKYGEYEIKYSRVKSLGFLYWFHIYSLNSLRYLISPVAHPNIAIFDARRSLGQYNIYQTDEDQNDNFNYTKVKRNNSETSIKPRESKILNDNISFQKEIKKFRNNKQKLIKGKKYYDPLNDPNFDPYQGYTYTNNSNDKKIGKGYLGEYFRAETGYGRKITHKPVLWNGGWHLSSCFQRIDEYLNKIISYSDNFYYKYKSLNELKYKILSRMKANTNIYNGEKKYYFNKIILPESYKKGYNYNFEYNYWIKNHNVPSKEFIHYINIIKHEVPTQVWKNPICYSYFLERNYGLNKKLWWQIIPKKDWKTVHFEAIENKLIDILLPKIVKDKFKKEMFKK